MRVKGILSVYVPAFRVSYRLRCMPCCDAVIQRGGIFFVFFLTSARQSHCLQDLYHKKRIESESTNYDFSRQGFEDLYRPVSYTHLFHRSLRESCILCPFPGGAVPRRRPFRRAVRRNKKVSARIVAGQRLFYSLVPVSRRTQTADPAAAAASAAPSARRFLRGYCAPPCKWAAPRRTSH